MSEFQIPEHPGWRIESSLQATRKFREGGYYCRATVRATSPNPRQSRDRYLLELEVGGTGMSTNSYPPKAGVIDLRYTEYFELDGDPFGACYDRWMSIFSMLGEIHG